MPLAPAARAMRPIDEAPGIAPGAAWKRPPACASGLYSGSGDLLQGYSGRDGGAVGEVLAVTATRSQKPLQVSSRLSRRPVIRTAGLSTNEHEFPAGHFAVDLQSHEVDT